MLLNCCVGEHSWVPWTARRANQFILKEISPEYSLEGLILSWNANTLATWYEDMAHWKWLWCWERLKVGEGDNRGWDDWMASLTQWAWVWLNFRSCWWTGRPGMLHSMGSQKVGYDWVTELKWTDQSWNFQLCHQLALWPWAITFSKGA